MISRLPDRPLSASETLKLSHERDDLLVIPATPDSLVGGDGSLDEIRNVLVFISNVVASLVNRRELFLWTVLGDRVLQMEHLVDHLRDDFGTPVRREDTVDEFSSVTQKKTVALPVIQFSLSAQPQSSFTSDVPFSFDVVSPCMNANSPAVPARNMSRNLMRYV